VTNWQKTFHDIGLNDIRRTYLFMVA